jgi:hypothetical protein
VCDTNCAAGHISYKELSPVTTIHHWYENTSKWSRSNTLDQIVIVGHKQNAHFPSVRLQPLGHLSRDHPARERSRQETRLGSYCKELISNRYGRRLLPFDSMANLRTLQGASISQPYSVPRLDPRDTSPAQYRVTRGPRRPRPTVAQNLGTPRQCVSWGVWQVSFPHLHARLNLSRATSCLRGRFSESS